MKNFILTAVLSLTVLFAFGNDGVPFQLKNSSLKSIYLEIPGVMNPNLSPISKSGVELVEMQKVYFFHKNEKYLLLEVDSNLTGEIINVPKLIRERKKELGL